MATNNCNLIFDNMYYQMCCCCLKITESKQLTL